jgi:hypothetical protein
MIARPLRAMSIVEQFASTDERNSEGSLIGEMRFACGEFKTAACDRLPSAKRRLEARSIDCSDVAASRVAAMDGAAV